MSIIIGKWKNRPQFQTNAIHVLHCLDNLYSGRPFGGVEYNVLVWFHNECYQVCLKSGANPQQFKVFTAFLEALITNRKQGLGYLVPDDAPTSLIYPLAVAMVEALGECSVMQIQRAREAVEKLTKTDPW